MKRKRIAFLDEGRGIGGAETNLLSYFSVMDKTKFEPFLILACKGKLFYRVKALGIPCIVLPGLPFISINFELGNKAIPNLLAVFFDFCLVLFKSLQLRACLKRNKIDIIHTNAMFEHIYGGFAARITGIFCVWHMQDKPSATFLLGFGKWFINMIARYVPDRVIVISKTTKESFGKNIEKKLKVIYYGLDLEKFIFTNKNKDELRREFNIEKSQEVVAIISRIVPWKGHEDFIKAANLVLQKRTNTKFLIAGDTSFGKKKYLKKLVNLIHQSGLQEKIIFIGFADNIENILCLADVIAHCSVKPEPFGLDIIEAMAAGKIVISTNCGAPPEIIDNEVDGILVNPNDPFALASGMVKVLEDKGYRDAMSRAAQKKVELRFSIFRYKNDLEKIYDEA
jgi:L-malate glycosyltransferase